MAMTRLAVLSIFPLLAAEQPRVPPELDRYNVVWASPERSERDSMPLGNGEAGISLWVQEDGDLQFYIARTDALTEQDRNVKLGKVRVRIAPNPFRKGISYSQRLELRNGRVEIRAGGARLRVFVHAEVPVVFVEGEFSAPSVVRATYQTWRTKPRPPGHPLGATETADIVEVKDGGILFHHANGESCIRALAELQGLKDDIAAVPDTLKDRKFGGWMTLTGARPSDRASLSTERPVKAFEFKVATHSAQTATLEEWTRDLRAIAARAGAAAQARQLTAAWWNRYWASSWIFASGSEEAEAVTRAYVHTKWMYACARGGNFPMLFNGGLFNLMPAGDGKISIFSLSPAFGDPPAAEPTFDVNPDIRAWGHMNLYQNQRLPYLSMLARGEADSLRVLFRYYRRFWDLNRARARIYYGATGQHNTEITQSFGLQPGGVYGYKRDGLAVGYSANRWGGAIDISPGLELAHLMLDYFDYTQDQAFLKEEALPYVRELIEYIATRFPKREGGKIVVAPLQSAETYWDTTDPAPVVAGMRAVLTRLLSLPPVLVTGREFFDLALKMTPDLATETVEGQTIIAPARRYEPVRKNVESPAFYAIFPFRLFGVGRSGVELAAATFRSAAKTAESMQPFQIGWRPDTPSYSGWQQHGMVAALLGLADDARQIVVNNSRLNNPGNRFDAMWRPIYDAVPDIDHGANILNKLQLMAFQVDGGKVKVLPAWPKSWDVSFRFHADRNTTIECVYRDGSIKSLLVTPAVRQRDVQVMAEQALAVPLPPAEIFVSPSGKDDNPGTKARPLKTWSAAKLLARRTKAAGPVTVWFRSGIHYLPETVVFTPEDSGSKAASITYAAFPGEEAIISGGVRLNLNWTSFRGGIMAADLPAGFTTDQLFVNGRRQHMARYPNYDAAVPHFGGWSADAFRLERASRWANPMGGFIHAMHRHLWGDFHYVITGKDAAGNVTYEGGWQNNRRLGMHDKYRFVENIFEELDAPGEWYLDRAASRLYLWPPRRC